MTVKNPIDERYMVRASMDVLIAQSWSKALKNVGVYSDPNRTSAGETGDETYSNWKTKKIKDGDMMKVDITLHEINPSILAIIDGGSVKVTKEAASVTDRIEKFMPGQWGFNKDVLLESRNADGTVIEPSEVKALINGVDTTLVKGTDYEVGKTAIGDTFVKFKSGTKLAETTPSEATISIKYSCTPDATLQKMKHETSGVPLGFVMVLEEKRTYNGKEMGIRFKLEDCKNTKSFHKAINDGDSTSAGYPCEITGRVVGHEFFGFGA